MTDSPPVFTELVSDLPASATATFEVALDWDARRKRRQLVTAGDGTAAWIQLERLDHPLADGAVLRAADGRTLRVVARSERLLSIVASGPALLRCAYHLGNRHAQVEVAADGLRTPDDPVMRAMLTQLGAEVGVVEAPFRPEVGAYHHEHDHSHGPAKIHRFVLRGDGAGGA
ncbi:MAG: urease accessory protein UreE [Myxococcota bacterium]